MVHFKSRSRSIVPVTPERLLLIEGTSGIGKSRLVEEFRCQVQLAELPCGTGGLAEQGGAPYAPLTAALRRMVPIVREVAPAVFDEHAPVLAELLPDLGVASAPEMDTPDKQKWRLQWAIASMLIQFGRIRPSVLVIEDWQWADPLTAECVSYLGGQLADESVAIVITTRPTASPPLADTKLILAPLDEAGVQRIVHTMLNSDAIDPAFIARVHAHCVGNPFYVERLLEHLVTTGRITWSNGTWDTTALWSEADVPIGTSGLLATQIAGLPPDARAAIRAAAVLGDGFDLELLQSVTGLDDEQLFDAVDALSRAQMVIRDDSGQYAFAQDQFAELILASFKADERRELHGAALRAIEKRFLGYEEEDLPLDMVTALTRHAIAGAAATATVMYAGPASRRLAQLYANDEAAAFARAGLAALEVAGRPDEAERRLPMLETLGDVMRATAQWQASLDAYREAIAITEALGSDLRRRGWLLGSIGKVLQELCDYDEAIDAYGRAAMLCAEDGDVDGELRSLMAIARIKYFQGHREEVLALMEAAVASARAGGNAMYLADSLAFLGLALLECVPERADEGTAHIREAFDLLEGLGDKVGLIGALNLLGTALNFRGDQRGAREAYAKALRTASECGLTIDAAFSNLNLGHTDYFLGDFENAAHWAAKCEAMSLRASSRFPYAYAIALGKAAEIPLGRFARLGAFSEAIAVAVEIGNTYLEVLIRHLELETLTRLGITEAARETGGALAALVAENVGEPAARAMSVRALVAAQAGALEEASGLATDAAAIAHRVGAGSIEAWALRTACEVSLLREDWEAARRDGETAAMLAADQGLEHLAAEVDGLLGEVALSTGRAEDAARHFSAMAERCEASGYALLVPEAYFGRAAARPYDLAAAGLVERAIALLDDLAERLPADCRDAFLATRTRRRIAAGNHIEFSIPRVRTQAPRQFLGSGPLAG